VFTSVANGNNTRWIGSTSCTGSTTCVGLKTCGSIFCWVVSVGRRPPFALVVYRLYNRARIVVIHLMTFALQTFNQRLNTKCKTKPKLFESYRDLNKNYYLASLVELSQHKIVRTQCYFKEDLQAKGVSWSEKQTMAADRMRWRNLLPIVPQGTGASKWST